MTLSVTDDGQGFDTTQVAQAGHLGIVSMRERAQAVGGGLSIESDGARGTTMRLTLPIEHEEP
jgi:signal transduction histidine kinase